MLGLVLIANVMITIPILDCESPLVGNLIENTYQKIVLFGGSRIGAPAHRKKETKI